MFSSHSVTAERLRPARVPVVETKGFAWLEVVQVGICSTEADHFISTVLIRQLGIRLIGEQVCDQIDCAG